MTQLKTPFRLWPLTVLTGCLLAGTLSSCTPAIVRASDARFTAQASTPNAQFTFNCNPVTDAQKIGQVLTIQHEQNALSCLSSDGQAVLTLNVIQPNYPRRDVQVNMAAAGQQPDYRTVWVDAESGGDMMFVLLVVLGNPPQTFYGPARPVNSGQWNLFRSAGMNGKFTSQLAGGARVEGSFNLVGKR